MTARRTRELRVGCFVIALLAGLLASPIRAANISLTPEAAQALNAIYAEDPETAILIARQIQQADPNHPLGYLLEAEAKWWERYCGAYEIKYGMADAWKRGKKPDDDAYIALADKVTHLAESQLAKSETAEMHLYAGLGLVLEVRVYALRGENRNVARAGVKARAEMLRALELDPQMADATADLGIYNYYVDTLSPIVKLLRIFMGIPGGDKETGVEQMETGMNQGVLTAVDVRFILSRALRQYDRKYEQALSIAQPLAARYPHNLLFLLLLGNLNLELGRDAKASEYFHSVLQLSVPNAECASQVRVLANSFLASLH